MCNVRQLYSITSATEQRVLTNWRWHYLAISKLSSLAAAADEDMEVAVLVAEVC